MDELSPLFQDIEFRERLRGYDVAEVDAYVGRVARAVAAAQARITELQQRVEAAEGREPQKPAETDSTEMVSRVLVLAQRTADAAVAEAQEEAAALLDRVQAEAVAIRSEADEHASRVRAEVETDRRRAAAAAEAAAAEAIAHERERVTEAIAELEQHRAFLTEDIDILERHLEECRSILASSLVGLSELLEAPELFRVPAMPALSGTVAPAALDESAMQGGDTEQTAEFEPIATPMGASEPEDDIDEQHLLEGAGTGDAGSDDAGSDDAVDDCIGDVDVVRGPESDDADTLRPLIAGDGAPVSPATEPPATEEHAPPLFVTAADLDGGDFSDGWRRAPSIEREPSSDSVAVVPDTQLVEESAGSVATTAADPFLEQLREAVARGDAEEIDDEALAAFFDGGEDEGSRSWFPHRR
ncbi:MAG: DivIVA domain-containing protein [Acidimicrobiales bacterium]